MDEATSGESTAPPADVEEHLRPLQRVLARLPSSGVIPEDLVAACRALVGRARAVATGVEREEIDALDVTLEGAQEAHGDDRRLLLGVAWRQVIALVGVDAGAAARRVRAAEEPAKVAEVLAAEDDLEDEPTLVSSGPVRVDGAVSELGLDDDLVERLEAMGVGTAWSLLTMAPLHTTTHHPVQGAGRPLPAGPVAIGGRVRWRVTRCRPTGAAPARESVLLLHGAADQAVTWAQPFSNADLLLTLPEAKVVVVGHAADDGAVTAGRLAFGSHGSAWALRYREDDAEEALVQEALASVRAEVAAVEDTLSEAMVARHGLVPLADAVARVLERGPEATEGRRRLAVDELVLTQVGLSWARFQAGGDRGVGHTLPHRLISDLTRAGEISALTDSQQAALEDIKRDLLRPAAMRRILLGSAAARVDAVARQAILMVAEARGQVLVIGADLPSTLVHHAELAPMFRAFGVEVALFFGEPRRAEREALRRGEVQVVFATPGCFDLGLEWRRLGLVVLVEQAGHGGTWAKALAMRNPRPDVLALCRTPVPAARVLDAYAVADVSWVEAGEGATPVGTVWPDAERETAYARLAASLRDGASGVIAFPLTRGGTDLLDPREAGQLIDTLRGQVLGGAEVVLYHGAQAPEEREAARAAWHSGRAKVLLATTMFEITEPPDREVVVLLEHSDRMDLQRVMGWRAFAGTRGRVHYVIGAEPRVSGVATVERLAAGESDERLAADLPAAFPLDGAPVELPPTSWAQDAEALRVVIDARVITHELFLQDPALRQPSNARLHRLAHPLWARLPGGANPLPQPSPPPASGGAASAAGKRRRRRRKRR